MEPDTASQLHAVSWMQSVACNQLSAASGMQPVAESGACIQLHAVSCMQPVA